MKKLLGNIEEVPKGGAWAVGSQEKKHLLRTTSFGLASMQAFLQVSILLPLLAILFSAVNRLQALSSLEEAVQHTFNMICYTSAQLDKSIPLSLAEGATSSVLGSLMLKVDLRHLERHHPLTGRLGGHCTPYAAAIHPAGEVVAPHLLPFSFSKLPPHLLPQNGHF